MKRNISFSSFVMGLLLVAATGFVGTPSAQAQNSNVMYASQRIPQTNALNPAFFPKHSKFYISLPGANINFTSPLAYNSIFQYEPGDTAAYINLNNLIDTLSQAGNLNLDANIYAVGLGLKLGNTFVTASAQAKVKMSLGMPNGLMTFLNDGNYAHRGLGNEVYLLDGDLLNATAYAEAGVAVGHEFGNLTVGARLKVFDGYFDLSTVNTMLKLYTAEDLTSLRADVNYQLRTAGCISMDENFNINTDDFNYLPNNWGYGVDLGAYYRGSFYEVSASILDLGSHIEWKDNIKTITPSNGEGSFSFGGLDLSGLVSGGSIDTSVYSGYKDSLIAFLDPKFSDGETYKTSIPTKFNASGMFNITSFLRAGLLFHGEFNKTIEQADELNNSIRNNGFRSSTTALAHLNLNDWVEVFASASVVDDGHKIDWFNPGFGINVSLFRTFQVYAVMDYLSNIHLVEAKSFNIYAGLNLILSNKKN